MTRDQQLELGKQILDPQDFTVWRAKHFYGYGRHTGSAILGITPEQFRHRLARANRTMKPLLTQETQTPMQNPTP